MPDVYTITSAHIRKLGHTIDEIRLRALDNIISKFELGFLCNCESVKQDLISKLFNWFSFDTVPQPGKCLNLLLRLVKDDNSYLNVFGMVRFQNELRKLHTRLDPMWYEKLNEIEDAVLDCNKLHVHSLQISGTTDDFQKQCSYIEDKDHGLDNVLPHLSQLDSTIPFDLTLPHGDIITVSKLTEGGIKWLAMPWQPLVASDRGVLTAVEEALKNTVDVSLILHTCRFITNVMLQDFPAEVFLQRPSIIIVLHSLLELCENTPESYTESVIPTVLKTLHKLTRSLIFRIHYYCDPCVANRKQKLLAGKLDNNLHSSPEIRHSPDGSVPEANYQAYQSAGTSNVNHCNVDNIDETVIQLQQMFIPTYCIESLKHVVLQLNFPINSSCPLRNIKYVTNLAYELIRLLNTSIQPSIWLCSDGISLKVNEDLKALLKSLGEIMNYLGNCSSIDYFRITYLHIVCITMKLLSNLVPLELADTILPQVLKISICTAVMDAPIFLMYPVLHMILQNYSHHFKNVDEMKIIQEFDECKVITKSMQATISILKQRTDQMHSDTLNALYAAQLSLPYHKNINVIKKTISFLQHVNRYSLSKEDSVIATKLILSLLANADTHIQQNMYYNCHELVKSILGLERTDNKLTWENISFILEPSILREIICHGATHESTEVKNFAEDILVYILKGRIQMAEIGWLKLLNAINPVLPVLQCHAHSSTPLGQCITKMLDPDVSSNIQLSHLEVLKGNLRLLYSPEYDIREEAACRLLWFLEKEKDSVKKLPRLSSLHGLPLCSLCIFEKQVYLKQLEGSYQKENLLPVLAMLSECDLDPKIRKSALVQISVMLSDSSLHKVFLNEKGLPLILKIFNTALMEDDCTNYPDSVIPIIAILKSVSLTESLVRHELSAEVDVLLNILRSIFLFPNNECVKIDGSQLLSLLLYNEYIVKENSKATTNYNHWNISLPYIIVTRMKLPFVCKSYWKISAHRKTNISVFHSNNQALLTFIRQYWAWEWNGQSDMLWKPHNVLNDSNISQTLMIQETELFPLQYSYPLYYCQQQLYKIQNSTTHNGVLCALDYLAMYLTLYKMLRYDQLEIVTTLPWKQTFERFIASHPTTSEDCNLFVDVLNFLQLYINVTKHVEKNTWITDQIRNVTNSLTDLFRNLEVSNHDAHQSILKLARICAAVENNEEVNQSPNDTWIWFIELIVSTLYFSDHQHFYNLAYLDWLLTCLTHLIGHCQWENYKTLLASLANALIELIVSFHGAGTVSFMGLSITKNSVICLNQLLHQMQKNLSKNTWTVFWYEEGRSLSWLPMLWQNRDPLVRASALQLLAGLMNVPHTMPQLLNSLVITPTDLCYMILQFIGNQEESPIVREQACIAFSHFVNNCNTVKFQYVDMLQTNTILNFVERCNVYYEISILCSNIYTSSTLDCDETANEDTINEKVLSVQSIASGYASIVPHTVSYLYSCHDEAQPLSARGSETIEGDSCFQSIATPSLITAVCSLLNDLILIGQHEVIRQIYQHSIDKYLLGSFSKTFECSKIKSSIHYCDILEMFIGICRVLTNSIIHSNEYATTVIFSSDSLYTILKFLNLRLCYAEIAKVIYLESKLLTEVFNFITVLSLTNDQHCEPLQVALELFGLKTVFDCICVAMKDSSSEVRMSAISCLTFILSIDIQKQSVGKGNTLLRDILDSNGIHDSENNKNDSTNDTVPRNHKLSLKSGYSEESKESEEKETNIENDCEKYPDQSYTSIGIEIGSILVNLFVAHSYARYKKTRKQIEDKEIITSALSNVFCLSNEAKKVALEKNFPKTILMILKELYVKLNLQPFESYKHQSSFNKKLNPLIYDINCLIILLMNFMYKNLTVKEALTEQGLSDVMHKLWPWIALNKSVCTGALKLLSTFTTKCPKAAQSITLTSSLPGTGLRKTRNTISLIHVIIQLICKEMDKIGQMFDTHKMHFAFHILRNAVHVHECRDLIAKSTLLHFFTKIHPITTKRTKPWPLIEVYCLEFLIDFTYYEEGQQSVSKAIDGLDVLIQLAKCSCPSTKFLAISVLRNLTFNIINRSRFLSSVDFINLLHDMFKHGSLCEIGMAGSMLWPLICNNQKGKLTARSAGFVQSIQEAVGSILLLTVGDTNQDKDLMKMLQYIMHILAPPENKNALGDLSS